VGGDRSKRSAHRMSNLWASRVVSKFREVAAAIRCRRCNLERAECCTCSVSAASALFLERTYCIDSTARVIADAPCRRLWPGKAPPVITTSGPPFSFPLCCHDEVFAASLRVSSRQALLVPLLSRKRPLLHCAREFAAAPRDPQLTFFRERP
jgi:hypothetical protein